MTRGIGFALTWGALLALGAAAWLAAAGRLRASGRAHAVGAALAASAVAALAWAFATGDLTLSYVAATSDRSTSWPYRLAGIWGGMAGSLLLWSSLLAAWGLARRRADRRERVVLALVPAALLAVVVLWASPWHRLLAPAIDGEGLTPILLHPAMLYHPPLLYLGATALVVPFAAVLGGVPARDVRRWLLGALTVLTAAMAAGAHWAYVELGWGGFWAWDPVENTALLPWLAALAALHLLRRPGSPVAATTIATGGGFVLVLLGTTLTRSGAAPSVHAFAEDAAVGRALVALVAVAAAALLLRACPSSPKNEGGGVRPARREVALRVQPVLVAVVLAVVLVGTVRPFVGDAAVAVDGSFYAGFAGPVAIAAAVALVAAGVVLPGRGRRLRPFHVAHVGFLVLLVAILGSTAGASATATLAPGESLSVHGWEVRHDGLAVVDRDGRDAVEATVLLRRDGDVRTTVRPALVGYPERGRLLAETSLRSTPFADVQVALRDADDDGRALLEVTVRPLVWWVWWGAGLLVAAGLWATVGTTGPRDHSTVPQPGRTLVGLPAGTLPDP